MENQQLAVVQEELNEQDINLLRTGALTIKNKDTEIKGIKSQISDLRSNIKDLEQQRKLAEDAIIPIMSKGSIDELNISTGKIKYIEKEKKSSLSKKNLQNLLENFFMNDENINKLLNITGLNNIDISKKRTKMILEFMDQNLTKKKVILLQSEFKALSM